MTDKEIEEERRLVYERAARRLADAAKPDGGGDPREAGAVRRRMGAKTPAGEGTGPASKKAARGATGLRGGRVVLVTGGRDYADEAMVRAVIEGLDPRPDVIIHGGATGADALAGRVAREIGIPVRVFPADWTRYGRSAGPIRNAEMVALRPDLVLVFPGGKGTANCAKQAFAAGLRIVEVS